MSDVKPWDMFSGMPRSTEEEAQRRISICEGCSEFGKLRRCSQCGCFMDAKTKLQPATCPLGKWETIFISIASYRDGELVKTVRSAWENARHKDSLFFSIVSQAEDSEHPDLSFIPEDQIRYIKVPWQESTGACWAREIASRDIAHKYFLQIDSHSRFRPDWDLILVQGYKKYQTSWGDKMVLTNYPDSYILDLETGEDILSPWPVEYKLRAEWDEGSRMVQARWEECEPTEFGHEIFFVSGNNLFCDSEYIRQVPYDKELYFTGEEPSLALRFYTRGFKLISPSIKYMYTNYSRENTKRPLHWVDNGDWWKLNKSSYQRLAKIMTGDTSLGVYGIESVELFKEYQDRSGIYLEDKYEIINSI